MPVNPPEKCFLKQKKVSPSGRWAGQDWLTYLLYVCFTRGPAKLQTNVANEFSLPDPGEPSTDGISRLFRKLFRPLQFSVHQLKAFFDDVQALL